MSDAGDFTLDACVSIDTVGTLMATGRLCPLKALKDDVLALPPAPGRFDILVCAASSQKLTSFLSPAILVAARSSWKRTQHRATHTRPKLSRSPAQLTHSHALSSAAYTHMTVALGSKPAASSSSGRRRIAEHATSKRPADLT